MLKPKYSILVPSRNGGEYLKSCIDSILNQTGNFELIVSDDHSDDGSAEYLAAIESAHVTILHPPMNLSMAEHWEWLLSHASGEWLIFVGQDDGLQKYFFELADKLTDTAKRKNIRAIMSKRAYYFWPGCQFVYGDISVSFRANQRIKLAYGWLESIKALLGLQHYFELPQMYTTSLFHRSLLSEAKAKLNGRIFVSHPQDANLAAIACSLDMKYLKSFIPLGWVGTSPKSAGMAISSDPKFAKKEDRESLEKLKDDYEKKILTSPIQYAFEAGDFNFGDTSIYFLQSLLKTKELRVDYLNNIISGRIFKTCIFASLIIRKKYFFKNETAHQQFKEILHRNRCNYYLVKFISPIFSLLFCINLLILLASKLTDIFRGNLSFICHWKNDKNMTMSKASSIANNLIRSAFIE